MQRFVLKITSVGIAFLFLAVTLVPTKVAADDVGAASMEFATAALPSRFGDMHLGWFFYNMYMTEWYSFRAQQLSGDASGILFELAANKETNARLARFDKEIADEKKDKKKQKKLDERNQYMDQNIDSVDATKKLDDGQKKRLVIALLKTATATIMQQRAIRGAKRMIQSIPDAKNEATSIGNPLGKARTIKNIGAAGKSLPNMVSNSESSLTRLAKISGHLNTLAKTNNVKAPTEKEAADAETQYVSEITFED